MIEIRKINDEDTAKRVCKEHHIEWNPAYHVIATMEQGKILHCAIFDYCGEEGKIHVISGFDDDISMLDGLCRAILNIMDINGVKYVYLSKKYDKIAQKVGFSTKNDAYYLSLDGFFKCKCHQ